MDGVVAVDDLLLSFFAKCAECQTYTELTVCGRAHLVENQEHRPQHIKVQCPWCSQLLDLQKVNR